MAKKLTVLGVITARGGSKGVSRKNLHELLGKPLIAYTIAAAQESSLLTTCIVSTDDEEIATIARSLGADVPFMRPAELATEESRSLDVMRHALDWMQEHRDASFDYAMILQPTSPLRTAADIDACIRIAAESDADSVMSMVEIPDFAVQKLKQIHEGRILPLLKEEGAQSASRAEAAPVYKRNTAIYLTKASLIHAGDLFGTNSRAYVMPLERSLDINHPVDLALAEFWVKRQKTCHFE